MSLKKKRIRRSAHFVPGPNEKMLNKAIASDADLLILDLEDAVAPKLKEQSRKVIANWLRDVDFGTKEVAVRINPLETPWGLDDLRELLTTPVEILMLPKVERISAVRALDSLIGKFESQASSRQLRVELLPICGETPLGLSQINQIASEPRVTALTWGAEDLASEVGSTGSRDENGEYWPVFEQTSSLTLIAAKTFGLAAIDAVYVKLGDIDGLKRECEKAVKLGFNGKLTIHPEQIPVVNELFTPTVEEVNRAHRLIEAFSEAQATGLNAIRFEGQMVDAPHLKQAKNLISKVAEIELA